MSERPPIPPPGSYRCNDGCGAIVERPGVCGDCADRQVEHERRMATKQRVRREIPERFRWAHWDAPGLLEHVSAGPAKIDAARRACASGRAVLLGPAGAGKTSLACAHLRERIEADPMGRNRFLAAHDIASPSSLEGVSRLELALTASALVLDDLGAELAGAAADSGLAAQRSDAVVRLVRTRHDQGLGIVVTTAHGPEEVARIYGDGVARRVFEGAAVVRLA